MPTIDKISSNLSANAFTRLTLLRNALLDYYERDKVPGDMKFEVDFDMDTFGETHKYGPYGTRIEHYGPPTTEDEPHCGFTACALGIAALIPEFQEAGFFWNHHGIICFLETGGGLCAASEFFEISGEEADALFGGDYYGVYDVMEYPNRDELVDLEPDLEMDHPIKATPSDVARRIELFIEEGDMDAAVGRHNKEMYDDKERWKTDTHTALVDILYRDQSIGV